MGRAFFARPVLDVARDLVGATLLFEGVGGTIVETEAYSREDPASHSFGGRTARNAAMFGPVGHAYIYRSYGIHWCLNLVCGVEARDGGSAVLIRALEPRAGLEAMRARRGAAGRESEAADRLCAGPGRLCQALGLTRAQDGWPLDRLPFGFEPRIAEVPLLVGPRIGLSKAVATPWRFGLAGSRSLSRPFRKPA